MYSTNGYISHILPTKQVHIMPVTWFPKNTLKTTFYIACDHFQMAKMHYEILHETILQCICSKPGYISNVLKLLWTKLAYIMPVTWFVNILLKKISFL